MTGYQQFVVVLIITKPNKLDHKLFYPSELHKPIACQGMGTWCFWNIQFSQSECCCEVNMISFSFISRQICVIQVLVSGLGLELSVIHLVQARPGKKVQGQHCKLKSQTFACQIFCAFSVLAEAGLLAWLCHFDFLSFLPGIPGKFPGWGIFAGCQLKDSLLSSLSTSVSLHSIVVNHILQTRFMGNVTSEPAWSN